MPRLELQRVFARTRRQFRGRGDRTQLGTGLLQCVGPAIELWQDHVGLGRLETDDDAIDSVVTVALEQSDVFLGALGKGAESFLGTIDNTQVFSLVKNAIGI